MTKRKVWLITGAGRGLGVDIAMAVLATGHAVVATGRDAAKVEPAVGRHESMLPVTLDVTRPQDAHAVHQTPAAAPLSPVRFKTVGDIQRRACHSE